MDLVGTNVLGNATGLLRHHIGSTQCVKQLGLAVVDVTHDRDDWRTRLPVLGLAFVLTKLQREGLEELTILVFGRDNFDVVIEFTAEQFQRVVVNRLSGRDHFAELEQHSDEVGRAGINLLGEVSQGCTTR